ncbi:MAG: helix-turn-helix domain-containing protein [Evtepia sp.]
MKSDDDYIGIEKVTQYLGISVVTLCLCIKSNDVPSHKIRTLWVFKRSELDEWVNSRKSAK